MSNNPAPFPKRPNPLTDAMEAISGANMQMGSPVGVRTVPVATDSGTPYVPLSDEEKRARELDYLAATGHVAPDSILGKEIDAGALISEMNMGVPEVSRPVHLVTPRFQPPSHMSVPPIAVARMQPIDFSDIWSIDFKDKSIVVAGTTLPLTEKWFETLADLAADAMIDSMVQAGKDARKRLLPVRSTDGEKVPEVPASEATDGIQQA